MTEWTATADVCQTAGAEAESAGRRVSAVSYYRRAATYYATALYRFSGATDHSPRRELELWRRQRACWDRVVDLQPVPGERISIPYEDTTLRGFFFRAPDATPGEQRPLVVMNNGSDGATSAMWLEGGAGAAERGYHWMTFDGPGQQAALYEQHIPFRHDWEAVLSPVLDTILPRPDVDADHVALIGVSQAGYWVPRAIAFEHRFAAAVADGGIVDVSTGWIEQLPEMMRKQLNDGERDVFDREMQFAESSSPAAKATLDFRAKPYGFNGGSRFDLYQAVASYRLGDEVDNITVAATGGARRSAGAGGGSAPRCAAGQLGQYRRRAAHPRAVAARYPDRPEPWTMQGGILRGKHRYAEAVAAYDQAIALTPQPDAGATGRCSTSAASR